ncbi:hypothetical protein UlMin_036860 [Ulmus minor]
MANLRNLKIKTSICKFGKRNMLAESRMMIPDCQKRLEAALVDLKATVVELDQKDIPEIEEA